MSKLGQLKIGLVFSKFTFSVLLMNNLFNKSKELMAIYLIFIRKYSRFIAKPSILNIFFGRYGSF